MMVTTTIMATAEDRKNEDPDRSPTRALSNADRLDQDQGEND
jgi:hypothetical protein